MYIRRKVFSSVVDENGEERTFSTTEFLNEETYLEQQKEFGIADKLAKKAGKALTRTKENMIRSGKILRGKDLSPAEVDKAAALARLNSQKVNKSKLINKLPKKLSEGVKEEYNIMREDWAGVARKGKGAKSGGYGIYVAK